MCGAAWRTTARRPCDGTATTTWSAVSAASSIRRDRMDLGGRSDVGQIRRVRAPRGDLRDERRIASPQRDGVAGPREVNRERRAPSARAEDAVRCRSGRRHGSSLRSRRRRARSPGAARSGAPAREIAAEQDPRARRSRRSAPRRSDARARGRLDVRDLRSGTRAIVRCGENGRGSSANPASDSRRPSSACTAAWIDAASSRRAKHARRRRPAETRRPRRARDRTAPRQWAVPSAARSAVNPRAAHLAEEVQRRVNVGAGVHRSRGGERRPAASCDLQQRAGPASASAGRSGAIARNTLTGQSDARRTIRAPPCTA